MSAAWGRERDRSVTKTSWDRSVWERKNPDSFEKIWKIGNHLEKFGSFWMYWDSWQGIFLLYAQKLSGRAKTFRVAMLPCYPGFWASAKHLILCISMTNKVIQWIEINQNTQIFKAELRAAEVDPHFKICLNLCAVFAKTNTYFWSDRFKTNRTWVPYIWVCVLFVSKRSDQNKEVFVFANTSYFL